MYLKINVFIKEAFFQIFPASLTTQSTCTRRTRKTRPSTCRTSTGPTRGTTRTPSPPNGSGCLPRALCTSTALLIWRSTIVVSLNYYYLFIKMYKDFVYLLFLSYLYNFLFIKIYTLLFIYKGVRHLYKCANIKKK